MSERLPLFRQKHYKFLMSEISLSENNDTHEMQFAVDLLCRALKKDNPNFNTQKFITCLRRT